MKTREEKATGLEELEEEGESNWECGHGEIRKRGRERRQAKESFNFENRGRIATKRLKLNGVGSSKFERWWCEGFGFGNLEGRKKRPGVAFEKNLRN